MGFIVPPKLVNHPIDRMSSAADLYFVQKIKKIGGHAKIGAFGVHGAKKWDNFVLECSIFC